MGLFDFLKDVGKSLAGGPSSQEIQANIVKVLGGSVENLTVELKDGTVALGGLVDSVATKQKVVLLAGNVKGVSKVNDDQLMVKLQEVEVKEPEFQFYTIVRGDSLSKIAKKFYGNANKWPALFEANREVIENPDLIYPGQQIRVPTKPGA